MSDSDRQPASRRRGNRRRSLYRMVLSLAVAALLAASLPFSVIYVNAVVTRASLAAKPSHVVQSSGATTGQPVHALAPVTTRTSGTPPP
jgi:hypothetical protein